MRPRFSIVVAAFILSGCADERIIEGSRSFSANVSHLQRQEVIDNIDETIDNRFRIPRRTTFGKGSLQFADAATLQISVPLHLFDKNAGSASGSAGSENNTYQLSIAPDIDGPALKILREIYQGAVYPDDYKSVALALRKVLGSEDTHFIYWGDLDAPALNSPAGLQMFRVGQGLHHSIWTNNPDTFENFVLLTYGTSPETSRVSDTSNPALIQTFVGGSVPTHGAGSPRRHIRPGPVHRQQNGASIPTINLPTMPQPALEKRVIKKEDEIKGFSLFPHAAPGIPQLQVR